jgi:hypothetical protein
MTFRAAVVRAFSGGVALTRRGAFAWVAVILLANEIFGVIDRASTNSVTAFVEDLCEAGIFQLLAWYAVLRLLAESENDQPASKRDIAVAVALGLLVLIPIERMIWLAVTALSVYLLTCRSGDAKLRSAATVLGALAVQSFWGNVLFHLIAYDLLRAETAVLGILLSATHEGITWQDNIIRSSSSFGIVMYTGCSSFFNVMLALLCWTTLTKLQRPFWRGSDFVIGAALAAMVVVLNFARLYMVALDLDHYHYWHDGVGAQIFSVVMTLAILVGSLWGAHRLVPRP